MKILTFSDTHSDLATVKELASEAKSLSCRQSPQSVNSKESACVDALLCAGDISEFGENIEELFKTLDISLPMIYIPGNHEDEGANISKKFLYVKNIHKKALVFNNVLFMGCAGGGFSKFFSGFDRMIPIFKEAMAKHKGKSVLVTHAPPYKTKLDLMGKMDVGAEPIKKFIVSEQPDFAISGHIHENAGKRDKVGKTICINPGKKGVVIDI